MKVFIHSLVIEIPDVPDNLKVFRPNSSLVPSRTKAEIAEELLENWYWTDHPNSPHFNDLNVVDQGIILRIVIECLTDEICQRYVDKIVEIESDSVNESWFYDNVIEFEKKIVNELLNSSIKFHAFKLLHT